LPRNLEHAFSFFVSSVLFSSRTLRWTTPRLDGPYHRPPVHLNDFLKHAETSPRLPRFFSRCTQFSPPEGFFLHRQIPCSLLISSLNGGCGDSPCALFHRFDSCNVVYSVRSSVLDRFPLFLFLSSFPPTSKCFTVIKGWKRDHPNVCNPFV